MIFGCPSILPRQDQVNTEKEEPDQPDGVENVDLREYVLRGCVGQCHRKGKYRHAHDGGMHHSEIGTQTGQIVFFEQLIQRPGHHHVKNDGYQKSHDTESYHHMALLDGSQRIFKNGFQYEEIGEYGGEENDEVADACGEGEFLWLICFKVIIVFFFSE
jgi:hypothetical protein